MRISELSKRSGVPIPTIKYYLRERLVPPGATTAQNQATYDETHLHRLRLVRAFIEVGGLSVAATRGVLATVDDPHVLGHHLLGIAHRITAPAARASRDDPAWYAARREAAALVSGYQWRVASDAPALDQLADAIAALRALGLDHLLNVLPVYQRAAQHMAEQELRAIDSRAGCHQPNDGGPQQVPVMEAVVVGTVLGEVMLAALRRLAQEDASARLVDSG